MEEKNTQERRNRDLPYLYALRYRKRPSAFSFIAWLSDHSVIAIIFFFLLIALGSSIIDLLFPTQTQTQTKEQSHVAEPNR